MGQAAERQHHPTADVALQEARTGADIDGSAGDMHRVDSQNRNNEAASQHQGAIRPCDSQGVYLRDGASDAEDESRTDSDAGEDVDYAIKAEGLEEVAADERDGEDVDDAIKAEGIEEVAADERDDDDADDAIEVEGPREIATDKVDGDDARATVTEEGEADAEGPADAAGAGGDSDEDTGGFEVEAGDNTMAEEEHSHESAIPV